MTKKSTHRTIPVSTPVLISEVSFRKNSSLIIATAVLSISIVFFFGFVDPGEQKSGRILIDEKHSNWEWSTDQFDTVKYGERTTYNYFSLAEYLKHYYKVDQKFEELTDVLLINYDILFIKTPTEPYNINEINAIRSFVKNGGSLFLIGDHTNVFGTSTNLNPIANLFGVRFNYDGQYDLEGELSVFKQPMVIPHPVVQNMPTFMFATGCTLEVPFLAENVIVGYGNKSVNLDYSRRNFFPINIDRENMEFGLFVQAAGVTFGKGRAFFFTDSTVWSNFYMFIPGKPELLLGIIEWLNRKNSIFNILRLLCIILASLSIIWIVSTYNLKKIEKTIFLLVTLFTIHLVSSMAILSINKLNTLFYPIPQPHAKYIKVAFETQHSNFELPVTHTPDNPKNSYHTFYVWLQRLNYVPVVKSTFVESLQDCDAMVLINPRKPFTEIEIEKTEEYLRKGGKLFLIDDPNNNRYNIANQLLSKIGLRLNPTDTLHTPVVIMRSSTDTTEISGFCAGEVIGGVPYIFARNSLMTGEVKSFNKQNDIRNKSLDTVNTRPILAIQKVGSGMIAAMSASSLFTDLEMGSTSSNPTTNMKKIYELEYFIFRDLLITGKNIKDN
jgi:hypothetical protein